MMKWTGRTIRRFIAVGVGLAVMLAPWQAIAGLYKCARDDGTVTYQEDPCPAGKELRDLERDPPTLSIVPFRVAPGPDSHVVAPRTAAPRAGNGAKSRKESGRKGNPAERKFLVPGIGEGEVVARVGRPDMSTSGGRKIVRWTYLPVPDDPGTITTLTFELGRLVEVERKVIPAQ